jgi:hypothetical protein
MVMAAAVVVAALSGCDRMERDWKAAQAENTVPAYEAFQSKYPQSQRAVEAEAAIAELKWQEAVKQDTVDSYQAYLDEFPAGRHKAEALARIEALEWDQARKDNTPEAYGLYLQKYPEGAHAPEARERVEWDAAMKIYTLERFLAFLRAFPESEHVGEAKAKAQELAALAALGLFEREQKFKGLSRPARELWDQYQQGQPLASFEPRDQHALLDLLQKRIMILGAPDFSLKEVSPFPLVTSMSLMETRNHEFFLSSFPDGFGSVGGVTIAYAGTVSDQGVVKDRYKVSTKMPWEKFRFPLKEGEGTFITLLPMGEGSIYRIIGPVKGLFTEIESSAKAVVLIGDPDDPLYFVLLDEFGFTYLAGKGTVALGDGKEIKLPKSE